MALIISGGGAEPLVTQRKRKIDEERLRPLVPFDSSANLANLSAAHFALKGTYPSPEKARLFLQLGAGKQRSVEDWKALINPESLLPEVTGVPTVAGAQYDVARRAAEAVPFEPSGIATGERRVSANPIRNRFDAAGLAFREDDDIDPILEYQAKVQTFGTTGMPSEWTPAPAKDVGKINDTIDYLRKAQVESRDVDLSPADRARHDVVVGNMGELARELAARRTYLGLENDFDPSDPNGKGIVAAYREYVGYSQLPAIILNDGSKEGNARAEKALKVIADVYQLDPGEDPQEIIDAVTMIPETLIRTGVPDLATLDLCYKSAIAGRPFGQSELKARWDYVFMYGRDKLPPEAAEEAAKEESNINTFMAGVAKYADPGGIVTKIMDKLDPLDGLHERFKDQPGATATAVNVAHWFSHSVTHMDINALLDRPLVTFGNLAELAFGDYEVQDGQLVHTHGEYDADHKFWNLFAAESWQAAWDASEGKMFVPEAVMRTSHNLFGYDTASNPHVNEALLYSGYVSEIAAGAAVDNLVLAYGGPLLVNRYKKIHEAARVRAETQPGVVYMRSAGGQPPKPPVLNAFNDYIKIEGPPHRTGVGTRLPGKVARQAMDAVAAFKRDPSAATFEAARRNVVRYIGVKSQQARTALSRAKSDPGVSTKAKNELIQAVQDVDAERAQIEALTWGESAPSRTDLISGIEDARLKGADPDAALGRLVAAGTVRRGVSFEGLKAEELAALLDEMTGTQPKVAGGDFVERAAALDQYTQTGPQYDRFIGDALADARRMMAAGRVEEAEHWLSQAEARASTAARGPGRTPRAEEAESFYTDLASDMRGSGTPIDEELPPFHPADVEAALPGILGESETQLRFIYAYDEAMRRTMAEFDFDPLTTKSRGELDLTWGSLLKKHPEAREMIWDHLADVMEERGLWRPGGLAETSIVEEGVAGQSALAFEGERITGDTQLSMGAIDEGAPPPKAKPQAPREEMPGQTGIEVPKGGTPVERIEALADGEGTVPQWVGMTEKGRHHYWEAVPAKKSGKISYTVENDWRWSRDPSGYRRITMRVDPGDATLAEVRDFLAKIREIAEREDAVISFRVEDWFRRFVDSETGPQFGGKLDKLKQGEIVPRPYTQEQLVKMFKDEFDLDIANRRYNTSKPGSEPKVLPKEVTTNDVLFSGPSERARQAAFLKQREAERAAGTDYASRRDRALADAEARKTKPQSDAEIKAEMKAKAEQASAEIAAQQAQERAGYGIPIKEGESVAAYDARVRAAMRGEAPAREPAFGPNAPIKFGQGHMGSLKQLRAALKIEKGGDLSEAVRALPEEEYQDLLRLARASEASTRKTLIEAGGDPDAWGYGFGKNKDIDLAHRRIREQYIEAKSLLRAVEEWRGETAPVTKAAGLTEEERVHAAAVKYAEEYDRLTAEGKEPDFYEPPEEVLDFIEIREGESLKAFQERVRRAGINEDGEPIEVPAAKTAGLTDEEVAAAQAAREDELAQANRAFDEIPVEKAADGVKVKETSVGKVDSSIAADVELLNQEGFKTFGSHGFEGDHPRGHAAKDVDPYVEFDRSDLVRTADEIEGERADITSELEQLANDEMLRRADAEMVASAEVDAPKTPEELMRWLRRTRMGDTGDFANDLKGLERSRAFKGTLASKKHPSEIGTIDEVADHVATHYPWFGITDSDSLFTFISGYTKGAKLEGKLSAAARTKELMQRLDDLDTPKGHANDRFRAIVRAAKKTGMKVEKHTADGRTLVAVSGRNLHDFVEALTGKPVDPQLVVLQPAHTALPPGRTPVGLPGGTRGFTPVGGPQPPLPGRAVGLLGAPSKKGRVHWLLWNRAEVIAYHLQSPALIARFFRIPDIAELKPFVLELAAASDPDTVIAILERLRAEGGVPKSFDAAMPGIWDLVRASGYTKNLKRGIFRVAGSPAGMEGRHIAARHADRTITNMGYAFKMGKRNWTQADRDLVLEYADRAFRATMDERMHIVDEFCEIIVENMKAEGTWGKFERMVDVVRRSRAKQVAYEYRRAYTKGSKVVPVGYSSRLMGRIKWYERKLRDATDPVDRKALEASLKEAQRKMDDYAKAADIINGKASPDLNMSLETAQLMMDNLGYPTPFLLGELANTIRLPFDPRLMGWFHSGALVRTLVRIDSAGFDKLMRTWKMIVMGSLSFPMRVFGKDEAMRLFAEGIIPGSRRWHEMRDMLIELKGGRRSLAFPRESHWRKLTPEESDELDDLLRIAEPDEAQLTRLTELQGKAEGILTPEEMLEVRGEGSMDWVQVLSDDYELLFPNDPRYFKSLPHNLRKLHDESIMREFLKTKLREPDEIRAWLQKLLAADGDKVGMEVRIALGKMGRITAKQATSKGVRDLLRSTDRTGAAGNLAAFIEDWVDILKTVSTNDILMRAIRKPGSVPMSELRKIDPKHLWAIPTRDDIIFGRNTGGIMGSGTWNPLQLWYEGVTLRYMEGISNWLREQMFADGYGRALRELLDTGVDAKRAHAIAFERGMDYVNRVTFTRNPSILEDVLRNYVPFINSYRQFWRYWGRMLVRHPFAMGAAYQWNPGKDDFGMPVGLYTLFGLPTQTFWQESTGGLTGVAQQNAPNVSPFAALLFSSIAESSGVRIDGLPGLQNDNAFNPLSSLKALAFGLGMEDTWGVEKIVGDMGSYEREHAYLLKEFAADKGEPVDESGTTGTDWPFWVDFWNAFGAAHFDRPEFVMQGMTRIFSPFGTQKLTPQRTHEIVEGMRLLGDPAAVAKYRSTHPDFDMLQRYYEASTPEEKDRVANLAPWVVDYSVTTNDWKDGVYTFTAADYIEARESGAVTTLEDDEIRRNIAAARMRHWGGFRPGSPVEWPGFMERSKAEKAMEKQLQRSKRWAEAVARSESHGNADYYSDLMRQWDGQQPSAAGYLPGIFAEYARREAKAKDIPFAEYERTLSPVSIGEDFEVVYGGDSLLRGDSARDVDVERINKLIDAGLGTVSQARWWLRNTDYPDAIEAGQKTLREEALKDIANDAKEEFFDLDSRKLRLMGIKCGAGIDRAIADVRDYYYNTYKKVVDEYGTASREGRDARLAYNAYKDRRFTGVKGGEAFIGGLGERILAIPYFTHPNYASVASGHHAPTEQKLWSQYIQEAKKRKPDMKKIAAYRKHFTPYDQGRYQEFMRVNNMMFVAAMARYLREEMKESYSDYYQGPGNSAYSGMGTKMVGKLAGIIRLLIKEDKQRWGASAFAKDIYGYFESPHAFAFNALEWYSH